MSRDHARSHAGLSLTALAGLAAAGLCWAAASAQSTTDWSKARVVEIDLKNFAFSPSRLVLQPTLCWLYLSITSFSWPACRI